MAQYFISRGDLDIYEDTAAAYNAVFPPAVNQTATSGDATCADMRTLVDVEKCSKVVVRVEMQHSAAAVATLAHKLDVYWAIQSTVEAPPYSYAYASLWNKQAIRTAMTSYTATDANCKWQTKHVAVFTRDMITATVDAAATTGVTYHNIDGSYMQVAVTSGNTVTTATAGIRVVVHRFY